MSKRSPTVLLIDILEAAQRIKSYIEGFTFKDFVTDTKTVDAVVRNLEIIGEASKILPEDFKERYKHVPWKIIAGLRNRVAHEYFGIDESIVWKIASEELEPLVRNIETILKLEKDKER